jgi:hypothetical protein
LDVAGPQPPENVGKEEEFREMVLYTYTLGWIVADVAIRAKPVPPFHT